MAHGTAAHLAGKLRPREVWEIQRTNFLRSRRRNRRARERLQPKIGRVRICRPAIGEERAGIGLARNGEASCPRNQESADAHETEHPATAARLRSRRSEER